MRQLAFPEKPKPVAKQRELSSQQLMEINHIFFLYDKDGSGAIDVDELVEAMMSTGYDEEEIIALLQEHDANNDGKIDKDEFVEMMRSSYL